MSTFLTRALFVVMITDSPALSFEIPARDALGREHVEGKLVDRQAERRLFV